MGEPDYKMSWLEATPDYVNKVGRYPSRWLALRQRVRELANGKGKILKVSVEDKRTLDLAATAVYGESNRIREEGNPGFKCACYKHIAESGRGELYIEVVQE